MTDKQLPKILITGGDTRVSIDTIHYISSINLETFGADIAAEALPLGNVIFLRAKHSKITPFSMIMNHSYNPEISSVLSREWLKRLDLYEQYRHRYTEHEFVDYKDYAERLEKLVRSEKPDVVILAAAASDYLVENFYSDTQGNMGIILKFADDLGSKVKEWWPGTFLVTFELLVDESFNDFIGRTMNAVAKNECDLVVANDLSSIKAGEHKIYIINRIGYITRNKDQAKEVITAIKDKMGHTDVLN